MVHDIHDRKLRRISSPIQRKYNTVPCMFVVQKLSEHSDFYTRAYLIKSKSGKLSYGCIYIGFYIKSHAQISREKNDQASEISRELHPCQIYYKSNSVYKKQYCTIRSPVRFIKNTNQHFFFKNLYVNAGHWKKSR